MPELYYLVIQLVVMGIIKYGGPTKLMTFIVAPRPMIKTACSFFYSSAHWLTAANCQHHQAKNWILSLSYKRSLACQKFSTCCWSQRFFTQSHDVVTPPIRSPRNNKGVKICGSHNSTATDDRRLSSLVQDSPSNIKVMANLIHIPKSFRGCSGRISPQLGEKKECKASWNMNSKKDPYQSCGW